MTGTETICCPICQGSLKQYDRRIRKAIDNNAETKRYSLRRLRCQKCGKIHLELPDNLLPYKRYEAEVIEDAIATNNSCVPSDQRTIKKIRRWYRQVKASLTGVWNRMVKSGFASPNEEPDLFLLVRTAVNSGFWTYHPYGH